MVKDAAILGTDILRAGGSETLSAASAFKIVDAHWGKDSITASSSGGSAMESFRFSWFS
jgi:hypothetical protein